MSTNSHSIAVQGSNRPPVAEARLLRKSDLKQRIRISIYSRRNPNPSANALQLVDEISTQLPGKRRYLDNDQFNSVYGADPADLDKIAAWAKANRLAVVD